MMIYVYCGGFTFKIHHFFDDIHHFFDDQLMIYDDIWLIYLQFLMTTQ